MDIKITKNLPFNLDRENLPVLKTIQERDEWVEKNLLDTKIEDIKWDKGKSYNRPSKTHMKFSKDVGMTKKEQTRAELMTRNYCMSRIAGKIEYWVIHPQVHRNSSLVSYECIWDVYLNTPTLIHEITGGKLTHGHVKTDDMNGITFEGGDKVPISIEPLERVSKNEIINNLPKTSWLYIFERATKNETKFAFSKSFTSVTTPYRVYAAPLVNIELKGEAGEENSLTSGTWGTTTEELTAPIKQITHPFDSGNYKPANTVRIEGRINRPLIRAGSTPKQNWQPFDTNIYVDGVIQLLNGKDISGVNEEVHKTGSSGKEFKMASFNSNPSKNIPVKMTVIGELLQYVAPTLGELKAAFPNVKVQTWNGNSFIKLSSVDSKYNNLTINEWEIQSYSSGNIKIVQYNYKIEFNSVKQLSNVKIWNANNLINYVVDTDNNSTILGGKISNFTPIETNQEEGILEESSINNFVFTEGKPELLTSLTAEREDDFNTFILKVDKNKIENLEGLRNWKVLIENNYEIDIPTTIIKNGECIIKHHFLPTPNETEESFSIEGNEGVINIRTTGNTFTNDKDIIYGVNAFDTYKTNSPISSKLELLLAPVRGFMTGAGLGTFYGAGRFSKTKTKEVWEDGQGWLTGGKPTDFDNYKPGSVLDTTFDAGGMVEKEVRDFKGIKTSMAFGALGALGAEANVIIKRQDMKRAPETVKGSGSSYNDVLFNNNNNIISLVKYKFQTGERYGLIRDIYRTGVGAQSYLFGKFTDIERPRFTVMNIENLSYIIPRLYYLEYDAITLQLIIDFYSTPRRYWTDTEKMLEFDLENIGDNGDE